MNFKGFKKVGEDEHKAHFENKSGHVITIAKKGLSKKHLDQLSSLPLHAASGGVVGMFDGGSAYNKDLPKEGDFSDYAEKPTFKEAMDIKNWVGRDAAGQSDLKKENAPLPISKEPEPLLAQAPEQTLAPEEPKKDQVQQAAPQMAPQPRQPAQQPQSPQQPQMDYRQSPEYQKAAADYRSQKAPQYAIEDINWQRDLQNGHITPQTYGSLFAKQDTLGKIGTLFGLMVSGVGSGLSKQPNMVMQMMDNEIKNDLEAQMKSKDNAMNYYKAQQAAYVQRAQAGQAESETALNWQTAAINKMRIAAWQKMQSQVNRLPNGQQKMQAQGMVDSLGAAIQEKNMQDNMALADQEFKSQQKDLMMLEGMGDSSAGSLRRARNETYVPGIGEASVPVPQAARDELIAHETLTQATKDLLDYSKSHTNLIPGTPAYNTGVQKATILQSRVREALLRTVYRDSEKKLLNEFVDSNPAGALKLLSTQPKLKTLLESSEAAANVLKKNYGLPTHSTPKQSEGGAKQGTGSHKEGDTGSWNGKPVVFQGGKWRLK